MNLTEIKDMALSLSDRTDSDLPARLDAFLTLFEARMNRVLTASEFETVLNIPYVSNTNYSYFLPSDYGEMRSVKVANIGSTFKTNYSLTNSEYLENARNNNSSLNLYVIIGDEIELSNTLSSNQSLELVYIRNLPPLTVSEPTNWMSILNPDAYIFGLLVEINSFAQNVEGTTAWKARLDEVIVEIEDKSKKKRWSGNPLVTRNS